MYKTSFGNETDLILLVTGASPYSDPAYYESSVCIRNDSERSNLNIIVYMEKSPYYDPYALFYSLGST